MTTSLENLNSRGTRIRGGISIKMSTICGTPICSASSDNLMDEHCEDLVNYLHQLCLCLRTQFCLSSHFYL
uniref:Uncharacterized protein n=1 Tax=Megaselia scalaris TaxID=36166 RepID=T1GU07_MEGSC